MTNIYQHRLTTQWHTHMDELCKTTVWKGYVLNNRKRCYQKISLCTTLGRFNKMCCRKKRKNKELCCCLLTFILTPFSLTSSSLDFRLPSHCYPELADGRDFAFSISTFQQHLVEQWAGLRVLVVTQTACQMFLQFVSLIHLPLLQYSNGPVLVCCGLTAWLHTHLDAHPTSAYKGQPPIREPPFLNWQLFHIAFLIYGYNWLLSLLRKKPWTQKRHNQFI